MCRVWGVYEVCTIRYTFAALTTESAASSATPPRSFVQTYSKWSYSFMWCYQSRSNTKWSYLFIWSYPFNSVTALLNSFSSLFKVAFESDTCLAVRNSVKMSTTLDKVLLLPNLGWVISKTLVAIPGSLFRGKDGADTALEHVANTGIRTLLTTFTFGQLQYALPQRSEMVRPVTHLW